MVMPMYTPSKGKLNEDIYEQISNIFQEKGLVPLLTPNTMEFLTRLCMDTKNTPSCINTSLPRMQFEAAVFKKMIEDMDSDKREEINKNIRKANENDGTKYPELPAFVLDYDAASYLTLAGLSGAGLFILLSIAVGFGTAYSEKGYARKSVITLVVLSFLCIGLFLLGYISTLLYFDSAKKATLERMLNK